MRHAVLFALLIGVAPSVAAPTDSHPGVYPLTTCAVSGTELGGDQVILDHQGREVRLCGETCARAFEADAEAVLSRLDALIIASQSERYPLETCVVTGEELGAEGPPFELVHANRLVRLCCAGCQAAFEKDPAARLRALDAAVVAQQMERYSLSACPVSGQALGEMGAPFDTVVAGRLVRLCCAECLNELRADPAAALRALDAGSSKPKEKE